MEPGGPGEAADLRLSRTPGRGEEEGERLDGERKGGRERRGEREGRRDGGTEGRRDGGTEGRRGREGEREREITRSRDGVTPKRSCRMLGCARACMSECACVRACVRVVREYFIQGNFFVSPTGNP